MPMQGKVPYSVFLKDITRDLPIPYFKLIPILLPIPAFRANTNTDTADTTDNFYLSSTTSKSFCK